MVLNRNITKREEFELKRHFKKRIVNEINKFYKLTKNSKFLKEEEASFFLTIPDKAYEWIENYLREKFNDYETKDILKYYPDKRYVLDDIIAYYRLTFKNLKHMPDYYTFLSNLDRLNEIKSMRGMNRGIKGSTIWKEKKRQDSLKVDGVHYSDSNMDYTIQTFNGKKRKSKPKTKFVCPEKMF